MPVDCIHNKKHFYYPSSQEAVRRNQQYHKHRHKQEASKSEPQNILVCFLNPTVNYAHKIAVNNKPSIYTKILNKNRQNNIKEETLFDLAKIRRDLDEQEKYQVPFFIQPLNQKSSAKQIVAALHYLSCVTPIQNGIHAHIPGPMINDYNPTAQAVQPVSQNYRHTFDVVNHITPAVTQEIKSQTPVSTSKTTPGKTGQYLTDAIMKTGYLIDQLATFLFTLPFRFLPLSTADAASTDLIKNKYSAILETASKKCLEDNDVFFKRQRYFYQYALTTLRELSIQILGAQAWLSKGYPDMDSNIRQDMKLKKKKCSSKKKQYLKAAKEFILSKKNYQAEKADSYIKMAVADIIHEKIWEWIASQRNPVLDEVNADSVIKISHNKNREQFYFKTLEQIFTPETGEIFNNKDITIHWPSFFPESLKEIMTGTDTKNDINEIHKFEQNKVNAKIHKLIQKQWKEFNSGGSESIYASKQFSIDKHIYQPLAEKLHHKITDQNTPPDKRAKTNDLQQALKKVRDNPITISEKDDANDSIALELITTEVNDALKQLKNQQSTLSWLTQDTKFVIEIEDKYKNKGLTSISLYQMVAGLLRTNQYSVVDIKWPAAIPEWFKETVQTSADKIHYYKHLKTLEQLAEKYILMLRQSNYPLTVYEYIRNEVYKIQEDYNRRHPESTPLQMDLEDIVTIKGVMSVYNSGSGAQANLKDTYYSLLSIICRQDKQKEINQGGVVTNSRRHFPSHYPAEVVSQLNDMDIEKTFKEYVNRLRSDHFFLEKISGYIGAIIEFHASENLESINAIKLTGQDYHPRIYAISVDKNVHGINRNHPVKLFSISDGTNFYFKSRHSLINALKDKSSDTYKWFIQQHYITTTHHDDDISGVTFCPLYSLECTESDTQLTPDKNKLIAFILSRALNALDKNMDALAYSKREYLENELYVLASKVAMVMGLVGVVFGPVGALITAAIGTIPGMVRSLTAESKEEAQFYALQTAIGAMVDTLAIGAGRLLKLALPTKMLIGVTKAEKKQIATKIGKTYHPASKLSVKAGDIEIEFYEIKDS